MVIQERISIETRGRGSYAIDDAIARIVAAAPVRSGLCHLFVHHTSASLIICENADPAVRGDLESFLAQLAPDGDPRYRHQSEGPDDMAAHVRSVMTGVELSVPFGDGRLVLGTWQGIYLYEHRTAPHRRQLTVTLLGDG